MARRGYNNKYVRSYRYGQYGTYGSGWKRRIGFSAGKTGVSLSMPFLAGAAASAIGVSNAIPLPIRMIVASLPIRGIGSIKAAAQGTILVDGVKAMTGFNMNLFGGNGSSSDFA